MDQTEDYKNLISEIIRKQIDVLGADIAVQKASRVQGLKITDQGEVLDIRGDPAEILRRLVDEYISLSGEIVKNILNPVFAKYPEIKLNFK